MNKKTKGLLLVASLGSLFTFTSCGKENNSSSSQGSDFSLPEKVYFKVTLESGDGYTMTPLEGYDPSKVEEGRDFKFTIETKEGYTVSRVSVNGRTDTLLPDDDGVYTISSVSENVTIKAEVRLLSYRITFSGENFSVSPLEGYDYENVEYGKDFKFKIVVAEHNTLKDVLLNGTSLAKNSDGVYVINNVTSSLNVSVLTEENTYSLSFQDGEGYSIQLIDSVSDLTKIPYSKTVRFKVNAAKSYRIDAVKVGDTILSRSEDGTYSVRNFEGAVLITVEATLVKCVLTFDSNGGSAVASQEVPYETLASEPASPTRAGDEYFDSYTFDGWYGSTGKFDFKKPVMDDMKLVAKWKSKGQKYDEVKLISGSSTNITSGDSNKINVYGVDFTFSQIAWSGDHTDEEKKADLMSKFGGVARDNDGVFVSPHQTGDVTLETQNIVLPKIDFKTMLGGGKVMTMELGGYQNGASISINGEILFKNSGSGSMDYLNCAKAYFYREGEAVKLRAVAKKNPGTKDIYSCQEVSYTLSEEESNGTAGITIGLGTNKYGRHYWIGNPRIAKGEYNVLDFSAKQNVTVENGILKTRTERDAESGAPFTQWKETAALSFDGIGAIGNGSKPLVANYGKMNFNALFAEGKGVRFTLGAWNGSERLTYEGHDFGVSGEKPDNPTAHTENSIIDTWKNFQIEITRLGMRVYNHYEDIEYLVPLSEEVLSGAKGLTFNLGTTSNNHFFYLSNVKAFHA